MEDLHVHEVQQNMKVSKESSAATLGAMLPTVPPDKEIIKKEGIETMIPEEIMEFIYNEDASYTYAVEGAISNMAHNVKDKFTNNEHSKDLKVNSLPFKVRQLTIERATLKVKISWMSKRKSKQEKVLKYKKRLVEVEQALRKIQNSINNADEKKKIEAQIKELDASVTKSASAELKQRGVLESVNAFIREGKEQGFILSDVNEFTMESFYGDDLADTEFDTMTEGANSKMYFTTQNVKKKVKTLSKKAKKAIKQEKYDEAAGYIDEIQKEIDEAKKELKSYPEDNMDKNFIGMLVGWCMFTLKCLLQCIGVGVVGSVAGVAGASLATISTVTSVTSTGANILNLYHVVEQISANLKKNNGSAKTSLINGLYNRCLVCMDKMSKQAKDLSKAIKTAKKANAEKEEKETKESVFGFEFLKEAACAVDEDGDPIFVMDEYAINEDDFLMEGANADLGKAYLSTATALIGVGRKFKKAVKKNDYDEAKSQLSYMQRHVAKLEKAIKNYSREDTKTNIIGGIIGVGISLIRIVLDTFGISALFLTGAAVVGGSAAAGAAIAIGTDKIAEAKDSIAKALEVMDKLPSVSIKIPTGFSEYKGHVIACGAGVLTYISGACATLAEVFRILERSKAIEKEYGNDKGNDYFARILIQFQKMRESLHDMESAFGKMKSQKEINDFVNKVREEQKEGESSEGASEHKESVLPVLSELNDLYESGMIDTDSYLELMTEAKKPDDGMIPILNKLHDKGYKTKYSCAGHKDSGKKDRNDDGIVNGKLASAARIMFNGDYDFPDPPKHWGFKTVEGKDYLYVLPYSNDGKDPKAFEEWKNKYMASLDRWVDSLPSAKEETEVVDKPTEDKKDKEADVKESVNDPIFESIIDNTLAELFMDVNNDF